MNEEIAKAMLELSKNPVDPKTFLEPDLNELKEEVLEDIGNGKLQVKFFRAYARMSSPLSELQKEINDFLNTNDYYIRDIKFNVQKNFLLGSTSGEYEEDAYAMVIYEE